MKIFATTLMNALSFACWGQTYTLPAAAVDHLPPVQEQSLGADRWVAMAGGRQGLPDVKGLWVIYRHERLWYWFGPFASLVAADGMIRELNVRAAALRAGNLERYRNVMVRRLEVDDGVLERLRTNKDGVPLDVLLATLRNLERLTLLGEQLGKMKSDGALSSPESLAATRVRMLQVASDPSRDAYGSGRTGADSASLTGRDLDDLHAALGAAAARRILGPAEVQAMQRAGRASLTDLIQLEAAGLQVLDKLRAPARLLQEWGSRVGGALQRQQQGLPQDAVELLADLGELAMAALDGARAQGLAQQGASVTGDALKLGETAARRLQLPDIADILGAAAGKTDARERQSGSASPPPGAGESLFSALDAMSASRSDRHGERGAELLDAQVAKRGAAEASSFAAAASAGVRGEAVPQFMDDYGSAAGIPGTPAERDRVARHRLREAYKESLLEEAGVEPGQTAPLTSAQRAALDHAAQRRSGGKYHVSAPADAAGADAVAQAAGQLESGATKGEAGLTANDARNLAAQGSPSGNSSGTGQAKGGSGNLPLPGYMPLFESLARTLAYTFGIDVGLAKTCLMLAYALNKSAFESIAKQMESLHDQLVDAETANKLNDLNSVLDRLDQLQADYQKLEGQFSKAMEKGIQPVLRELAKRGAQAASEQALKEAAARLGVNPQLLRSVMQLPPDWDSAKAASALKLYAKDRALEELRKRGVPGGLGEALLDGDRDKAVSQARAFVQRRGIEQLQAAGLTTDVSRALMAADGSATIAAVRNAGEAQARRALNQLGYAQTHVEQILSGSPELALRALRSRSRRELEDVVARGQQGSEELLRALDGQVNTAQARSQAVARLVSEAKISTEAAVAFVDGDLTRISADELQSAVWSAGQALGWPALGKILNVDPRNLRIYAQSPSWQSDLQRVVRQTPVTLTRNANLEIGRQRALVALEIEREKREYDDLLKAY